MVKSISLPINTKHKDSLFRIIFQDKKELLNLYNALAGTRYDNPNDLTITTNEEVIYLHMKNDISFIVDDYLNLYEHQSTFNPNMPLRGLLYMADLYRPLVKGPKLYAAKEIHIPNPRYVVFYNGTKKTPEKSILKLSDSFIHKESGGDIEVIAHMYNINYGQNKELMQKCKKLSEYAYFVAAIRRQLASTPNREEAVRLAIEECIEKHILTDILERERVFIMDVLTEFDEEAYAEMLREEGFEDGEKYAIAQSVLKFLGELGNIPEELESQIVNEANLEKLQYWIKLSILSDSIEDFCNKTGLSN